MGLIMLKLLFVVAIVVIIIACGPIATILSLNTLFNLAIPITFDTWISAFWLAAVVGGTISYSKSK
jgi:MFS-type transporter involved in bile tolerance (Atg22 family)